MIRRALLAVLTLVTLPSIVRAQATPLVPPGAPVYRDIDQLAAAGLIDTLIVGTRPFSEREVVRLLREAKRNIGRNPSVWAARAIATDLSLWTRDANHLIDAVGVEAALLDSPNRLIPPDPNGTINATINPLASNRGGRPIADGGTGVIESYHSALLGPHVALSVSPLANVLSPTKGASVSDVKLQTVAANLLFGNVSIEAGRDYTIFGQAPVGGLLFSDNAPPLDMVRVSNDRPFTLPWWFGAAGPIRATVFAADLGTTGQIHPHSKLVGYHVAAMPHPRLEFGVEVIDAMGGNGGQPASFGDRILDAIPIFDVFRAHSDFQFSNKMAGADFHWREPAWHGFELYGETVIDDFDARRLRSVLLEDGGYFVGAAFSCITECGRLGVRAEFRQTGIRFYTHGDYPIAEDSLLLGDPLGPRGLGAYLTVDGESKGGGYLALTGAFEVRSGNRYGSATTGEGSSGFHFVQVSRGPGEKRARLVGTVTSPRSRAGVSVRVTGGMERVTNYAFVAGSDRMNWMASTAIVFRP